MRMMKYAEVVPAVNSIIAEYPNMRLTIRQIYYRLVSPPYQLFPNVMKSYKNLVAMLTRAREKGGVDWRRIEDRRRSTVGGESGYDNLDEYIKEWIDTLRHLERYYERKRWSTQPKYVEVWVEKEALQGLFETASQPWGVVVFPTVGYSSLTMFMEAVDRFSGIDKPILILDFRDHDPSGIDMTRDAEDRLMKYGADVEVKRCALTIEQVRELGLEPNPTKKADTRAEAYMMEYGDECWELDAYPPDELVKLVDESIKAEIDMEAWNQVDELETNEKKRLENALEKADDTIEELKSRLEESLEE